MVARLSSFKFTIYKDLFIYFSESTPESNYERNP